MIKVVEFLVRASDVTHEEFREYWLGDHSELAAELPGLGRYVTSLPTDPDEAEYDGVLELYFDSVDDYRAAFGSETGQAVLEDAENFLEPDAGPRMIVEETVQLDER